MLIVSVVVTIPSNSNQITHKLVLWKHVYNFSIKRSFINALKVFRNSRKDNRTTYGVVHRENTLEFLEHSC